MQKFLNGIMAIALSKYSRLGVSILITSVLSRLITPTAFGEVALCLVFVNFFKLLGELGLGPALIQNQNFAKHEFNHVFSFSLYLSLGLSLLYFVIVPNVIDFFGDSNTRLSISFTLCAFLSMLQSIPYAVLIKKFNFKIVGYMAIISITISGLTGILLAIKGFGVYSLVVYYSLDALITFVVYLFISEVKFSLHFDLKIVKQLFYFSKYQSLFTLVNYFSRNIDILIVSKFLGTSTLGYYDKAYRLMLLPVQNLTQVINPVLHPTLAAYQENSDQIAEAYYKVTYFLSMVSFPLSFMLFVVSGDIIDILYGDQWKNSVPVFQLLALSLSIQIISSGSGSIFRSMSNTKRLFISSSNFTKKIDIVILNNNSTDESDEIIKISISEHANIHLNYFVQANNIGLVPNSLFVLEEAKGKFVLCLGDDDYLFKEFLLEVIQSLDSIDNIRAIVPNSVQIAPTGEIIGNPRGNHGDSVLYEKGFNSAIENSWKGHQLSGLVFLRENLLEEYIFNKVDNMYPFIYFILTSALKGKLLLIKNNPVEVTQPLKPKDWRYGKTGLIQDILDNNNKLNELSSYQKYLFQRNVLIKQPWRFWRYKRQGIKVLFKTYSTLMFNSNMNL